jgi:hypothetical protein
MTKGMRKDARRRWLGAVLAVTLALPAGAAPEEASPRAADDARIEHALNRLGYGPRPGDVEAVRRMGLEAWTLKQLHPERIDDRGL